MITTPITAAYVRGVAELEPTDRGVRLHRLPAWVREQFPDGQLLAMEGQPSGARVVFRTAASTVELVSHPTRVAYRGADRPRGPSTSTSTATWRTGTCSTAATRWSWT